MISQEGNRTFSVHLFINDLSSLAYFVPFHRSHNSSSQIESGMFHLCRNTNPSLWVQQFIGKSESFERKAESIQLENNAIVLY